jgi:hypothetical protein
VIGVACKAVGTTRAAKTAKDERSLSIETSYELFFFSTH